MDCIKFKQEEFYFEKRGHWDYLDWQILIGRKSTKTLLKLLNNDDNPKQFTKSIVLILRDRGLMRQDEAEKYFK